MSRPPPPLLASDALREEVAPLEPARRATRIGCAGLAAAWLALAVAYALSMPEPPRGALAVCLAAAVTSAAVSALPVAYLQRALAAAGLGATVVALGLAGVGPLALVASHGTGVLVELARVTAASLVPAALLFRAHYPEYRRGRVVLAAALLSSLPYAAHLASRLSTDAPFAALAGSSVGLVGMLSAAFALLAAPAPRAAAIGVQGLTLVIGGDLALRHFAVPAGSGPGLAADLLTAIAFALTAAPIALGLFQALAAAWAPDARKVDVRRAAKSAPPPEDAPA